MSDFKFHQKVPDNILTKYKDLLPMPLLSYWQENGFGTLKDGYLKIVNPDDFSDLLHSSYNEINHNPIVMFATAMGDLIIWENNYTVLLNYRINESKVVESGFSYFMEDVFDEDFLEEELNWGPFLKAKEKLGEPDFDECFGYEPVLAAGGSKKIDNLRKVKIIEHIAIITQFAGKI